MLCDKIWNLFQKEVFSVRSTEVLFNQYRDLDLNVDLLNADEIRRKNLKNYLRSISKRPSIVIVGEAPGPWGCRFSGVPFTSEKQLCDGVLPFAGRQSSISASSHSENAATIFWKVMLPYHRKFFVWNCIPFHPHKRGDILSIRNPTRGEVSNYSKILSEILILIRPEHVVAVGRNAELSLNQIGGPSIYVRHPSRGGANDFRKGIERILSKM